MVYEPYGWLQTVSFYLLGVSILAAAIILQIKLTVRFNLGAIVLAVMGLAFFVIGSCRTPLPGGPVTLSAGLHTYATAVVVLTFPLACFLIAPTRGPGATAACTSTPSWRALPVAVRLPGRLLPGNAVWPYGHL